jgi:hypothetical protein
MSVGANAGAIPLEGIALEMAAILRIEAEAIAGMKRGGSAPYPSIASFVLAHGRLWDYAPRPKGVRKRRDRGCFRNAALLVLHDFTDRLTYCEGYAMRAGLPIPVLHAWVVTPEGTVIDPTWREHPGDSYAYLGVPFRTEYLMRCLAANQVYGLIDRYETGFPLLTGDHPVEGAIQGWPK